MTNTQKKQFIVTALAAYAAYWVVLAISEQHLVYWGWSAIALAIAAGVHFSQSWAATGVYCITAVTLAGCFYVVWAVYNMGWSFDNDIILSLVPTIILSIITILSSWFAFVLFDPRMNGTPQP